MHKEYLGKEAEPSSSWWNSLGSRQESRFLLLILLVWPHEFCSPQCLVTQLEQEGQRRAPSSLFISLVPTVPSPQFLHRLVDLTLFCSVGSMDFGSLGLRRPSFLHFDQNSAAGRERSSLLLLCSSLAHRLSCRNTESSVALPRSRPPRERSRVSFSSTESPLDSFSPRAAEEARALMIFYHQTGAKHLLFRYCGASLACPREAWAFVHLAVLAAPGKMGDCFPANCSLDCLFPFYIC